jgi:hypothetical protein
MKKPKLSRIAAAIQKLRWSDSGPVRAGRSRSNGSWLWLLALAILLLRPGTGHAQQVLVKGDVADDTLRTVFGPNRRYFGHLFGGAGFVVGPAGGVGGTLRYGIPSSEMELGARLKRRYSQTLALTLGVRYAMLSYALAQTAAKQVPSTTLHLRETLRLQQVQLESGLRLNAGRRGNVVGRYLDLLAWGGWVASTAHITEDEPAPNTGATTTETAEHGLDYLARWPAGLGLRVGSSRVALTGRYRLTRTFRGAGAEYPELPRGVLGLEIGFF